MKGLTGLLVAGAMGLLAIGVNMAYLTTKIKNVETIDFIGIRQDRSIDAGKTLKQEHFIKVKLPIDRAQNLDKFVYLWADIQLVVGRPTVRALRGGDLLLLADTQTPAEELTLGENEVLLPIDVGSRSPLIEPGDQVSFIVPSAPTSPGPSVRPGPTDPEEPFDGGPGGAFKVHGPFRVAAIGSRIGSAKVARAHRIQTRNSNQLGIVVKTEGAKYEAKAMSLLQALSTVNSRSVTAVLHSRFDE